MWKWIIIGWIISENEFPKKKIFFFHYSAYTTISWEVKIHAYGDITNLFVG